MKNNCFFYEIFEIKKRIRKNILQNKILIEFSYLFFFKKLNLKVFRRFENRFFYVPYGFVKKFYKNENVIDIFVSYYIEKKYKLSFNFTYTILYIKTYSYFKNIVGCNHFDYAMFIPDIEKKTFRQICNYVKRIQSNKLDYSNTKLGLLLKRQEAIYFINSLDFFLAMVKRKTKYPYYALYKKIDIVRRQFLIFVKKRKNIIKFYKNLIKLNNFLKIIYPKYYYIDIVSNIYYYIPETIRMIKNIK